jgi:hypothetical protein
MSNWQLTDEEIQGHISALCNCYSCKQWTKEIRDIANAAAEKARKVTAREICNILDGLEDKSARDLVLFRLYREGIKLSQGIEK